ncbi:myelin protein zero-like protein 2 [Pelobates fuscus]|uniref:myelin protein zero-like protein 2 n=1 Tax=Pelobates fuscus TaxID=191477 RepID=UPI002FE43162
MSAPCTLHLAVLGLLFVSAHPMKVYTSKELEALNGTDVRLKCTFSSESPLGEGITVSWQYRHLQEEKTENVFYYHREPYPPPPGRFKSRAFWDGNLNRGDASIMLRNVQEMDNGTYLCQVKNPPDVHGQMGEIMLRVVNKAKFSEIHILMLIIGVGSAFIILLVLAIVLFRYYRNRNERSTPVSNLECTEKLTEKPQDPTEVIS